MTPRIGAWLTLGSAQVAEIACRAGADWVCIDLEHSATSIQAAEEQIRVGDLLGKEVLVRMASHDPAGIARVLDSGAHGVIVPRVNTAAQAENAVVAATYPPRGQRGVGLGRAQRFGPGFRDYHRFVSDGGLKVIVQIEHVDALDHLEAIFAVPGVTGYLIGPYDLTSSMGIPGQFEDAAYLAALERIADAGAAAGLEAGTHVVEPDPAALAAAIDAGYARIAYSVDFRILDAAWRQGISAHVR